MSAAAPRKKVLREIKSGDWTTTVTTIAQVLIGIVALLGICAWATLFPVFILTFLFLEPLLMVGIILFIIAAMFSEKSLLVERFGPGEVVFHQGGPGDFIYVVRSGQFHGEGTAAGSTFTQKYGPGECFGITAVINRQPYHMTVTAETNATAVRINPDDLSAVAASGPQFEKSLRGLLEMRVADLIRPRPPREN